ncbi:MAG: DNA replication/repair protein RecF [Syntrophomonas sp.]
MILQAVHIKNFRNIENVYYEPAQRLNIFIGENGQGKTNLLEAIYVLAQGSSFRSINDVDLLRYDTDQYEIQGRYLKEEKKVDAALSYNSSGSKVFKINGKKTALNSTERLRVVAFTPDDLYLVKGPPSQRRSFLDFGLKQISADYHQYWDDFYRLLRKRNIAFKRSPGNVKGQEILEEMFCDKAAHIILTRLNYINVINIRARDIFKALNPTGGEVMIRYALSFALGNGKINGDCIKGALAEEIQGKRALEAQRGTSMFGPHRDDVYIYLDGRLARHFASQGQQRNLVVSIKLAELEAFREVKGYYPLFLLDEVLAELDEEKKRLLLEFLGKAEFQCFLSSVNLDVLEKTTRARVSLVQAGSLLRRE